MRERLLEAATEFAIERGLDGASLREIAERANVSSAMIAYYFGDRRGLHEAMFQRAIAAVAQELEAALSDPGDDDVLDTLVGIHATAMSVNPWLPRVVAREILGGDSEFRERFLALLGDGPVELLREAIRLEVERGSLRADLDPLMCLITVMSLTAFPYLTSPILSHQLGLEFDDEFRDRLIAHNRQVIARGLRAPSSEVPPA